MKARATAERHGTERSFDCLAARPEGTGRKEDAGRHFAQDDAAQDRPDLARKANAQWPTVIPSRSDGGEARFTCKHNKQEMEVRVEAATRITSDNLGWGVILLQAFIAPKGQGDKAEEVLNHMAASVSYSPAWMQKQNQLSAQAAIAINQRMQTIFRQERTFIEKLNSVDQNFQSMDEIVSSFSSYGTTAPARRTR